MEAFARGILIVFFTALIIAVAVSLPVMWLWNGLLHTRAILGTPLPELTWLQAWGLSILCGLLFKSNTSSK